MEDSEMLSLLTASAWMVSNVFEDLKDRGPLHLAKAEKLFRAYCAIEDAIASVKGEK